MSTPMRKRLSLRPAQQLSCCRLVASRPARRVRLVLALSACGIVLTSPALARAADPVMAAVGDIACPHGATGPASPCQQSLTAGVAASQQPAAVAVLGDNQYESGLLGEFYATGAYNQTWGKFNSIVHPVPGNHEYNSIRSDNSLPGSGYFNYFATAALGTDPGETAGPNGSYSYEVGSWHIIALNSNCSDASCQDSLAGTSSSGEASWLQSNLAAHPGQCTLAYWHHPLFSSGRVGNSPGVAPLWAKLFAAHADVVLNGHDHDYERFAQQDPLQHVPVDTTVDGIREFVVGTGGESLFAPGATERNTQVFDNRDFGVLVLTLHAATYDWKFVTTGGTTIDAGSTGCHAHPATSTEPASLLPTLAPFSTPLSSGARLTFRVKPRHPGLRSLRKHGLAVDIYCSRACDVRITVRVRRHHRMVRIARFRETESELPTPSTRLVLRGLWRSLSHLRVAFLQLTFVASDAAGHRVTISKNSTLRR